MTSHHHTSKTSSEAVHFLLLTRQSDLRTQRNGTLSLMKSSTVPVSEVPMDTSTSMAKPGTCGGSSGAAQKYPWFASKTPKFQKNLKRLTLFGGFGVRGSVPGA
eukprot:1243226-Amphidinium_carterae.1